MLGHRQPDGLPRREHRAVRAGGVCSCSLLARRLLPLWAAWVTAALFAVHPVHVEAVANVVGQSELIVAVALSRPTVLYLRDRHGRDRSDRRPRSGSLLLYAVGLFRQGARDRAAGDSRRRGADRRSRRRAAASSACGGSGRSISALALVALGFLAARGTGPRRSLASADSLRSRRSPSCTSRRCDRVLTARRRRAGVVAPALLARAAVVRLRTAGDRDRARPEPRPVAGLCCS